MSEYDKELDTRTEEYEEAIRPERRAEKKKKDDEEERRSVPEKDSADTPC